MEGCDYHSILARDIDNTPRYLATGTPTCMAANRLSYFFNLSGPSLAVDTACSSSMAALHQAVRTLQHRDAGMALVCSAKLILNPDMFMPSSELGFLSPSGKCQSFDAAADGYGRGEGVLALLLKPLEKAIADRDPIRTIFKGTRLNQDGRTQGITLPSADAQRKNMQALYEELGIMPEDIQYLEAHVSFIRTFAHCSFNNVLHLQRIFVYHRVPKRECFSYTLLDSSKLLLSDFHRCISTSTNPLSVFCIYLPHSRGWVDYLVL